MVKLKVEKVSVQAVKLKVEEVHTEQAVKQVSPNGEA